MGREAYRLTESVAGFPEGEVLDVTARFGNWHIYDMELEPRRETATTPSKVVVSEEDAGFSEEEILDETARIGDWHEYELAFEPGRSDDEPTALTMDDLETVAERVEG
ncbi:hypothetical protein [Halapricum desulfuricans]|uniref:Uncharacterized protein n=1 Tax=Halapricum desulfuricans TaxID=2841257 RepID=A0A897NED3_9EURY|nr:hypothetical protein [Halapricum desulfuricans]QSG10166.1 hypothetical protein HSR122_2793 [Halapricum desulfuricans]QSG10731.1 hypothetical protein HSBGL_0293 [Halapricum desulfuricans]